MAENLLNDQNFLEFLKRKLLSILAENHDWQREILHEGNYGYREHDISSTIMILIETKLDEHILEVLYLIESQGALDSFGFFNIKKKNEINNEDMDIEIEHEFSQSEVNNLIREYWFDVFTKKRFKKSSN